MAVQGEGNSLTLSPGGKNLVKSLANILANSLRIKTGKGVPLQIGLYLGLIRRHDLRGGFCRIRVYDVVRR
jgi:hypothetical protein